MLLAQFGFVFPEVVPFPLTVIEVRPDEARASSSCVGEGRANTVVAAAARAAATEKVFMMTVDADDKRLMGSNGSEWVSRGENGGNWKCGTSEDRLKRVGDRSKKMVSELKALKRAIATNDEPKKS